jgi:diacylglycerol kinase (ATP)
MMLTISNGRFFGGGFPIAPAATLTDGRLHACVFKDGSARERFSMFGLAEQGQHGRSRKVLFIHGAGFRVSCDEPPRFEVDGDVYQAADAAVEVEVLPQALEVIMPEPQAGTL